MAAKKETLLMRFLVSSRDAIRSFKSIDGALTRLNAKAEDAKESVEGVGEGAEKTADDAVRAFTVLGVKSDALAEAQAKRWTDAFEEIKNSGVASAADIERAQEQLNFRLERLNRQQARGFESRTARMRRALRSLTVVAGLAGVAIARVAGRGSIALFNGLTIAIRRAASAMTSAVRTITRGVTRIATFSAKLFTGAVVGGGAAAGAFAKQVGDVAGEFERISVALKATTGAEYERAAKFVEDFAKTVVFSEEQVAQSLLSLRNFGFSQADSETALPALVDQVSKLGGTYQDLEGITLAVGQAWAKSKLQGEEILQLVERGVPVWELLEKATGKNVQQLNDLSSKGKLGRDVIRQLLVEIGKSASGSAAGQLDTYNGLLAQLSKEWQTLLRAVGDSGVFGAVKEQISALISFLGRPEVVKLATRFAEVGVQAFDRLRKAGERIILAFGDRAIDTLGRWINTADGYFNTLVDLGGSNFDRFVSAIGSVAQIS